MSQSQINGILNDLKSQTEKNLYENRKTGTSELGQDAFLQLMMKQLQYQDPLNPMDNTQMLQQQAQFTQIAELQKMNIAINSSNQFTYASSLVGKTVTFINPEDSEETLEGKVTEAKIYSNGTTVIVDGDKEYPISNITGIKDS